MKLKPDQQLSLNKMEIKLLKVSQLELLDLQVLIMDKLTLPVVLNHLFITIIMVNKEQIVPWRSISLSNFSL